MQPLCAQFGTAWPGLKTMGGAGLRTGSVSLFQPAVRPRLAMSQTSRARAPMVVLSRAGGGGGDSLLTFDSLVKTHDGDKMLFDGLSCTVSRGQKLAIVGENGCGKSTFLRIVCGEDEADEGFVQRAKGLRVGYLPQEPIIDEALTILEAVVAADTPVGQAVREYEAAVAENAETGKGGRLDAATNQMEALGGWELDAEAKRVLNVLGLPNAGQKVGQLSGGQRKRVALAAALLADPDILVLDEPTNHMDINAIEWMEQRLSDKGLTLLLVTHDRYFMESVCNQVIEIDSGEAYQHRFGGGGSYEKFQEARQARREEAMQRVREAKNTLRKESEWMARQPKARATKEKARIQRFHDLSAAARAGPSTDTTIELSSSMTRQGKKILQVKDAGVKFGDKEIFSEFSYEFEKGGRVGVVGPNGAGKSTLLDILTMLKEPSTGEVVPGETTVVGYYTQHPPEVPKDLKIIDYVRTYVERQAKADNISIGGEGAMPVETVLEKVGFPRKRQNVLAGVLSGGERRRLHLATVLLRRPNFLVLDEPTNDLDLATIEVLEDFLGEYGGVLVTVSHDRAFMDNVSDELLVLEGDGRVKKFEGSYSEYAGWLKEKAAAAAAAESAQKEAAAREAAAEEADEGAAAGAGGVGSEGAGGGTGLKRLSNWEAREYGEIEAAIEALTEEVESLSVEMAASASDFAKLDELSARHTEAEAQLEEKTERWLELAERAEAFASSG